MREHITPVDVANEIRLSASQYRGAYLITEGSTDKLLYKNFVDESKCEVIDGRNKDFALTLLGILENSNVYGVLAIVDADFERLEKKLPQSPNILLTDTHDLETMLLQSPALTKLLAEFGSDNKLEEFVRRHGKCISLILVECGAPLGYLRWVSLKDALALTFEGISFSGFIERETLFVDTTKLIKEVKNKSQKHALLDNALLKRMDELKKDEQDIWQVVCGHDLVCILSIGLCKALGSCDTKEVTPEIIERSLRLAYEHQYFQSTELYQSILNWEKSNPNYKILN